jgi:antitoxin component of MazEF toxin-antitoxin module
MGRPATRPARLRNGFYIEVKTQGNSAILVRRDTREQMLTAAEDYSRTKSVTIRGEMRNDKWVES